MTFILNDDVVCAGKYVSRIIDNQCVLSLLSSSDNVLTPVMDSLGLPVRLKAEAHDLIVEAVRKHWTYVDLREYQIDRVSSLKGSEEIWNHSQKK